MVFSSVLFLFRFLPLVLLAYYAVYFICRCAGRRGGLRRSHGGGEYANVTGEEPGGDMHTTSAGVRLRNLVLFISSLVFYAWGEPVYVILMIFSTVVDYTHGRLVHRFIEEGKKGRAKGVVISSMIVNLGLLGFFKYADFFVSNINAVFGAGFALPELALPIGISFYTFQTMSYTIDIYRGDARLQRNILDFGAYVALFPQLIAGPIVKYKTIDRELNCRAENADMFSAGALRFITGLGKKVLIANNIGLLWERASAAASGELTVLLSWIGITAYAFQIYFDFSGYSDMAIGLGKMFGFNFPENFNYPYISKSITEFWRRWHISLGSWFRDYVYIPLGGNRKGIGLQLRNIAVVWLLTGFWHGAGWNFVAWGVYYGILLIMEKLFLLRFLDRLPSVLRHVYAIFFTWIGWVIFAFDDFSRGLEYLRGMFGLNGAGFADDNALYLLLGFAVIMLIAIIGSTPLPAKLSKFFTQGDRSRAVTSCIYIAAVMLLSVAYLVDATYNPFLYFRF